MGFWDAMVGMIYAGETVVEVHEDGKGRTVTTRSKSGKATKHTQSKVRIDPKYQKGQDADTDTDNTPWWKWKAIGKK